MAKAKSPRKQRLKVFRTAIGFHDAYVAAPSRKAALEAWGSSGDLFSQGAAELVTDPELMLEALARPGEVVRVSRGSADEQVKALGRIKKKDKLSPSPSSARSAPGASARFGPARERGRKPSRAAVDKAEQAVARAKARLREASDKLRAEELALEEARKKYRAAMSAWADE